MAGMNRLITAGFLAAALMAGAWNVYGKSVKNNVGQQLPELNLTYVGEKPVLPGKPLLIEFWATWCVPCRESIPHLNEYSKTYRDKGLVVIGITKEDEATVKEFLKDVSIQYFIGRDPSSELAGHLGITVIPHAIIVNRAGKITWEGHPETVQPGDIENVLK
jgi:thiol-disulfide isomerase/thioredoxin